MRLVCSPLIAAVFSVVCGVPVLAQNTISAKAGMINIPDGDVYLLDAKGGEPRKVEPKPAEFADVKEGQTLKTGEGRAEVLLTPGSFLRMLDDSSFKLVSNRLTDVRLDVLKGDVMIEAMEMIEGNSITVTAGGTNATLTKGGLYRFGVAPVRVRVYQGEALIETGGQKTVLHAGKELVATDSGWKQAKFDAKDSDALYRWSKRRNSYIAMANVWAARQSNSLAGKGQGAWSFNPYFGFATYLPWASTLRSPFGYYFYTPATVYNVYAAPVFAGGGSGPAVTRTLHSGTAQRSAFADRSTGDFTRSTVIDSRSSAPAAPIVSAPAAPAPASTSVSRAPAATGSTGGHTGRGN